VHANTQKQKSVYSDPVHPMTEKQEDKSEGKSTETTTTTGGEPAVDNSAKVDLLQGPASVEQDVGKEAKSTVFPYELRDGDVFKAEKDVDVDSYDGKVKYSGATPENNVQKYLDATA